MEKLIDPTDAFYEIRELLDNEEFEEAEEKLVYFAEQPAVYQNWAGSFINTLVYSILIPQQRFREAYAWLDDSIQGDFGYETWNSVSNLGHLMLRLGEVERAEKLFTTLIQSENGPIDEAEEFMEMIDLGEAGELNAMAEDPRQTHAYKQLDAYLHENGIDQDAVESFQLSRGGATYGFVQGILSAEGIQQLRPTPDAVAQVFWDYLTNEVIDPLPSYEDSLEAVKGDHANEAHRRVLREAAFEGSGEASHFLHLALKNEGLDYLPWLNVARARGYSTNKKPKMI